MAMPRSATVSLSSALINSNLHTEAVLRIPRRTAAAVRADGGCYESGLERCELTAIRVSVAVAINIRMGVGSAAIYAGADLMVDENGAD